MQSIYNIASGSIECQIVLECEKSIFKADEDVIGVVIIKTSNDQQVIDHDGIKISLVGLIGMWYNLVILYRA